VEALGRQGELPAVLGQDTESLPLELQHDAVKDTLSLKKFYNAARFHVGQKLPESPEILMRMVLCFLFPVFCFSAIVSLSGQFSD
jgi:hypothetical protein